MNTKALLVAILSLFYTTLSNTGLEIDAHVVIDKIGQSGSAFGNMKTAMLTDNKEEMIACGLRS